LAFSSSSNTFGSDVKLVQPYTIGPMALLLSWILRAWLGSLSYRLVYDDPASVPKRDGKNKIYLLWHEMMLFPTYKSSRMGIAVLISYHRDGELIARILKMMGVEAVRGSTQRRGMAALRGMMRRGKISHLAITPDGPRGPRRVMQPGAIYLASRTGMPLVPAGFAYAKCKRAGSWDRLALPWPGTRGLGIIGKPIWLPPDLDREGLEQARVDVQAAMDEIQARAERAVGR
jgi:lysophospholipid acyltransferase (LPLAT)-like uncharacterized protein